MGKTATITESLQPSSLTGRDEMNLAEFPIALVTDRVAKDQKTLYFEDSHGKLTVTASDAFGLPTAIDTDVIIALIYLTKQRTNFTDTKVNFSFYEIIRLLNWPDDGKSYLRLKASFSRWIGVSLHYDKCWWNNRLKTYTDAQMHIIESVELLGNEGLRKARSDNQIALELSHFTWNRKFIESCQADNLRQLDLDTYFALKSAISKRMYRFLGKRFYLQSDWTFDLKEIAFERVGLSRSYTDDAGKIKEKLKPALDELESIGFLKPANRKERYNRTGKGQWTVRLVKQAPALAKQPAADVETSPFSPIVVELTSRGVSPKVAVDLAEQHQADAIGLKIEVFDWLVAKQDKRIAKSPAGYLVKSIADDFVQPKGFIPQAEHDRREAAKRAEHDRLAASRRAERAAAAREQEESRRISDHWKSLTTVEQARLQEAADAQADPADLAAEGEDFKSFGELIRRNAYIRQVLFQRQAEDA